MVVSVSRFSSKNHPVVSFLYKNYNYLLLFSYFCAIIILEMI